MPEDVVVVEVAKLERTPDMPPRYETQLTQLYDSLPLSKASWIRILDVFCDNENPTGPLYGTLRLVDLRDSPSFTALSYVWGESSPTRDVVWCNSTAVPVTKSCYEAVCALRHIYGAMTIWIDAICINQEDEAEKSVQIPLIREIYTWAEAVYIWLGPGNAPADRALRGLLRMSKAIPNAPGIPWLTGTKHISVFKDLLQYTRSCYRCLFTGYSKSSVFAWI